jgi:hypothetical protein
MHIRLLSRLLEMSYKKKELLALAQGQVNNIIENYLLIHIAKHAPVRDTMAETLPHWENGLATAMGVLIGRTPALSRDAVLKAMRHLFIDLEELDRHPELILERVRRKMRLEQVPTGSLALRNALDAFMANVPQIAELVGTAMATPIDEFIERI